MPADSSAGVTVYATINDLPLTGVTEGSMALVDSTDKLYIFSDTGWYSIALVNTSPSISGVNPAYTLAMDGTALTISVTASDPRASRLLTALSATRLETLRRWLKELAQTQISGRLRQALTQRTQVISRWFSGQVTAQT